jgi:hydrogenase/urease accessory protein HupE
MRSSLRFVIRAALTVGIVLGLSICGWAHTVGISRGEYRVGADSVTMNLVMARPEFAGAVASLDTNPDGTISQSSLSAARAGIEKAFVGGTEIRSSNMRCSGKLDDVRLTEEDGVSLNATFRCPGSIDVLTFKLNFISALSHGHRHLANVPGALDFNTVAYAGNSEFQVTPGRFEFGKQPWTQALWPMFRLGIQHILTGYDHLVFLFGLILVGGRVRSILVVITAFTIAHSITLGLAVLKVVTPGTHLVEPAIALSIAYIGIENWYVHNASRRWMITFPFGLIHGFGFAGALHQIALPPAQIPAALLSFNLGVEAGQLAVLSVTLPAILWLRQREWFANRGVKALSAGIALAGVCWFWSRI